VPAEDVAHAAAVSSLLRTGRLHEAESVLRDAFVALPGPVASACLESPPASVEVVGWDELNADLARLTRSGHAVSAVGLDLSNYNDSTTDEWWDKEPCVEFAAYTDSAFPFSGSTTEEMLRVSETYAAPWTGCMLGQEDAYPTVSGLRRVNGALLRHEEERGRSVSSPEDAAAELGWWWQHLCFRAAVVRHLDAAGLALTVPVLAGSHDVGPWLVTVHPVSRLADHEATSWALLTERRQSRLADYERDTREAVDELLSLRENSRASWGFKNRAKRKQYVAYADARLALMCDIIGLPKQRGSIAHMHDDYFAGLVAAYVDWRRTRAEHFQGWGLDEG
jgi:hypothetical protein